MQRYPLLSCAAQAARATAAPPSNRIAVSAPTSSLAHPTPPLTHPITIAPTIHLLPHRLSAFLRDGVKAPLALGDVLLADGSLEKGFVGESYGVAGAPDISAHGGWRGFLQAQQQQQQQQ